VSGARYDIGQLVADYLRLSRAKRLEAGYVIAFVYGPLVSDAQSPGKLYRTFHNQMFVDFNVAKGDGQIDGRSIERAAGSWHRWCPVRPYDVQPDLCHARRAPPVAVTTAAAVKGLRKMPAPVHSWPSRHRRALLRPQGPAPGEGRSAGGPGRGHATSAAALRIMRRFVRAGAVKPCSLEANSVPARISAPT
jgi:hypothetical protein